MPVTNWTPHNLRRTGRLLPVRLRHVPHRTRPVAEYAPADAVAQAAEPAAESSGWAELQRAMQRPGFAQAWQALEEEYAALATLLQARSEAGLTQEEVAARMGTTKSAVSRLEASLRSPTHSPSFATLRKYAHACGKRLVVTMV